MDVRNRGINLLYRVATGSKRVRNLLTPIGATFFIGFTLLFVYLAVQLDHWLKLPVLFSPPLNILLSLPVFAAALFLVGWSVGHFLKTKGTPVPFNPPPRLVTTGPYTYTRNPMLTGLFGVLFGLGILMGSVTVLFIFTPLFILFNVWELKTIEEPELTKRLGEDYIQYRKQTPMFIPRLRRKNTNKK